MTTPSSTFTAVVFGDRAGYLALAIGYDGYRNQSGAYRHREWAEHHYAWPDDAEQLWTDLGRENLTNRIDVYVCPAVRHTQQRRKGDALPPMVCWADLDHEPADHDLVQRLDPYVVDSGQPGHTHLYLPLSEPVDLGTHAALNRALAEQLGGDPKWSDESLLRLPGTHNHKTNPPALVTEPEQWGGTVWHPAELARVLGVDLTAGAGSEGPPRLASVPVAVTERETPPDPLPAPVRRALEHPDTDDRSLAHARLVAACYDAGLTPGQTLTIAADYPPSTEKYGQRLPEEVARWWSKVDAKHEQQPAPVVPLTVDGSSALAPLAQTPEPAAFFDKNGVRAATLASAVETRYGPVATDQAGRLYRYHRGVWLSDGEHAASSRVVALLGDRYRRSHATNALDILAAREPLLTEDSLDTQYLNLPNGLLDWRNGQLHPHSAEIATFNRIPVDWHPDARCPVIDTWLQEVFPADAIPMVHEVIGYTLFNGNPLHVAVLCFGGGRNGKGAFLRLLTALVGAANTSAVTPQSLDEDRFRAAELHGKLANLVGDVDPSTFRATEVFKQITGGDAILAERKYRQPFAFTCRALMIAAFNTLPRTADTTEGFFSRWLVLPFTGHFPPGVADSSVEDRMQQPGELQGLLVHAVAGLQRVMARRGFAPPASVVEATQTFRQDADPVRAFLAESTYGDHNGWVPREHVFDEWKRWAEHEGRSVGQRQEFYRDMKAASLDTLGTSVNDAKRGGTRGFRGLGLRRFAL